ncbi:MAG: hypothetical protein GOVbin4933_8 [Prokaryotic dsDNA virus sp.]|nr:MAG: hypothetical protein GOVbin4933_8 [Prokaryotic dsDNA virus sp.]
MAKTNEEILEAVRDLDPQNDEHWTADGLPRLDAVENLLGGDVSRKAVTNAAPDFTRAVAQELVDAPENGEPPVDEPPVEGDSEVADEDEVAEPEAEQPSPGPTDETDTATVPDDEDQNDDPLAEGPADFEAELDAEILEAQEEVNAIRQGLEHGKRMLVEAEERLGRLNDEKDRAFPPMTQAEAIQRFQRNELAKRAAARAGGASSSPLDEAMRTARKIRRQGATSDGTHKAG